MSAADRLERIAIAPLKSCAGRSINKSKRLIPRLRIDGRFGWRRGFARLQFLLGKMEAREERADDAERAGKQEDKHRVFPTATRPVMFAGS